MVYSYRLLFLSFLMVFTAIYSLDSLTLQCLWAKLMNGIDVEGLRNELKECTNEGIFGISGS
jgi:hypothetical protein